MQRCSPPSRPSTLRTLPQPSQRPHSLPSTTRSSPRRMWLRSRSISRSFMVRCPWCGTSVDVALYSSKYQTDRSTPVINVAPLPADPAVLLAAGVPQLYAWTRRSVRLSVIITRSYRASVMQHIAARGTHRAKLRKLPPDQSRAAHLPRAYDVPQGSVSSATAPPRTSRRDRSRTVW